MISFGLRSIVLTMIFAFSLAAQTLTGIVTDEQKSPIVAADISLIDKTTTVERTKTDADGKFSIDLKNRQNLLVLVKVKGFASFSKILPKDFNEFLTITLEPEIIRNEVTVSITQTESRLSETPASVVVLNRETLEQTAAQTIDDSLRQVAGFTLFRRSSSRTTNPTTQGANLRGVSGSGAARTSVTFDGVSLNDAFGGWTYWTRAPKIAVENIEVLRGGASAFYGSSALGGAINLETKKYGKSVFRFETSAGTQNTFDGSLYAAFGENGWNVDSAIESFTTGGYVPVAETERGAADSNANSRYNSGFLTLEKRFSDNETRGRGDAQIFESGRVFLRGNLFAERRANGTRLTANRTYFRQGIFGADAESEKIGAVRFRASIETQIYDQTFSALSVDRNTENLTRVQRVPSQAKNADLVWNKVFGAHALAASANMREVRGFSDEIVVNTRPTSLVGAGGREFSIGVFAQDFWRATAKLNLNFGARFDRWKNFDARSGTQNLTTLRTTIVDFADRRERAFSPRVGALYRIDDRFSVLGSYAKSFRAPTLNELYRAFRVGSVSTLANENLRAERAATIEAGVNFTNFQNRLNARANVFSTEVSNPVVSVTLSATPTLITRQRQNVGKTRTHGFEIDAEFQARRDLRVSASYLFSDSRVTNFPGNASLENKFLPQIARQQITFQIYYRPPTRFSFGIQGRVSGAQFDDDQNALRLRSFFTLDWLADYRASDKLKIFVAAENIFDNRYDIGLTPNRTIAAPRSVRAGLRFNLR